MAEGTLALLEATRIVAILRGTNLNQALSAAQALLEAGIRCIEVTMTSDDTFESINALARAPVAMSPHAGAVVGAGTVLRVEQVERAIDNGAEFIVSPNTNRDVILRTKQLGKISIPGAMTPTEVIQALDAGADIVKVFPASVVGLQFFRDILGPLPGVRTMATGGVSVDNAADYIKSGAHSVGLGSALVPANALASANYAEIGRRARGLVASVRQAVLERAQVNRPPR